MPDKPKNPAAKPKVSKPRSTIFVIRDDEHERKELTKDLTKAGFTVHSYFTVREFILDQVYKTEGVILADYRLRGSKGAELVEQLGVAQISLPLILFVGLADVPDVAKLDVADFLVHPYEIERLLDIIDHVLNLLEYDKDELNETFRRLSVREFEILNAICTGRSSRDLGTALGISTKTVEAHRARISAKTRAYDVAELIRHYRAWKR